MNDFVYRFLKRVHSDDRGTSLTEFVITVPIFLVILTAVLDLGALINGTVLVEIEASQEMHTSLRQASEESLSLNMSALGTTHAQPTRAAALAIRDLEQNRPRRASAAGRSFIRLYEHSTYGLTGMAVSGSWGESHSRVRRLQDFGIEMAAIDELVTSHPEAMLGNRMTGSWLGNELFNDGPGNRFDSQNYRGGVVAAVTSFLNDAVSSAGMRGALAAGNRYGTVTARTEIDIFQNRGPDRSLGAHYTGTVGPYVNPNPYESELRSAAVTRFTFFHSGLGYYNDILRFHPQNPYNLEDLGSISSPTPDFGNPLDYDATLFP